MTNQQINNWLDYQILRDPKFKAHKELFNLTCNFSLNDWRIIHTKKYFQIRDNYLHDWQRKNYLLLCVKYYIKHLQNKNN